MKCQLVYDFILNGTPASWSSFEEYAKQKGIHVISTYNEGESMVVRASFPNGTLQRFQRECVKAGWFKKVD